MKIEWFEGLTPEQKKHMRMRLRENDDLFEVIRKFISNKISKIQENRVSIIDYEISNWNLKQVDFNAQERTYREILSLLNTKE